jgi:hypothetical protein
MLSLSNTVRLPTLANNCYIVGEAKRADVIWSEGDFKALCEHMLNENPMSHFLNVWIRCKGTSAIHASAARIFGWDKKEGPQTHINQLCITQEQLEQIRQLRAVPEPEQLQDGSARP